MNHVVEQVRQVDSLRSDIKVWADTASWLGGYLDHGRPSEEEERVALDDIARYDRLVAEAKPRLEDLVTRLRDSAPEVIETWVNVHQAVCRKFIDEGIAEKLDKEIGLFVARELIAEWEKVRLGPEYYVSVSDSILLGYEEYLTEVLA